MEQVEGLTATADVLIRRARTENDDDILDELCRRLTFERPELARHFHRWLTAPTT
jgi:hypothetical protein